MSESRRVDAPRTAVEVLQFRIAQACWQWKVFGQLFVADRAEPDDVERVRLLKYFGESFFQLVHDLLLHDVVLRLCKLSDSLESGPRKSPRRNLVLERIIDEASAYLTLAEMDTLRLKLAALRAANEPLREWRHKRIAHEDEGVALGARSLPRIRLSDIDASIDASIEILKAADPQAKRCDFRYKDMITHGDGHSVVQALRLAKAWCNHQQAVRLDIFELPQSELRLPRVKTGGI